MLCMYINCRLLIYDTFKHSGFGICNSLYTNLNFMYMLLLFITSEVICFSPSGKKKAVVVKVGNGDDAHQNLQIWNSETLEKIYDLKELDAHKAIYTSGSFYFIFEEYLKFQKNLSRNT